MGIDRRETGQKNPIKIENYDESTINQTLNYEDGCHLPFLSSQRITSCFCQIIGETGTAFSDTYHRWDGQVLTAFKEAAEHFKTEGVDVEDIPLMYIGTREGFISLYPAFDDPTFISSCFAFDPRTRPWYTRFTSETDRQVIFLLDRSSSMSNIFINGERPSHYTHTIIDIFIKSLKSDDLVRFFSFGNTVEEIEPDRAENCFINPSGLMVREISEMLEAVFDVVNQNLMYEMSFIVDALELMASDKNWDKLKHKLLLIFTDGMFTTAEDEDRLQSAINKLSAQSVRVVIFNFSTEVAAARPHTEMFDVQEELENAKSDSTLCAFNMVQNLLHIETNETIDPSIKRKILYSPPYYDAVGNGEVMTIGQPVYDPNGKVFGAVGIDTTLLTRGIGTTTKLGLGIFDGRFQSYLFMFDLTGLVIYHPFKPYDIARPVMYYDLEKNPLFRERMTTYLTNDLETDSIQSFRIENSQFPVNINLDGSNRIKHNTYNATFLWKKSKNLIVSIVVFDHEQEVIWGKLQNNAVRCPDSTFTYASDINNGGEWSRINDRLVNYNTPVTKFGVQSYRIEKHVGETESDTEIEDVRTCLQNVEECNYEQSSLKRNALNDICSISQLEEWPSKFKKLTNSEQSSISR